MHARRSIRGWCATAWFALLAFACHVASGPAIGFDPRAGTDSICSSAAPRVIRDGRAVQAPQPSQPYRGGHPGCPGCDAHCAGAAIIGRADLTVRLPATAPPIGRRAEAPAPILAWTGPRSRAPPAA
jgi:hypothetical protein